MFDTMLSLEQEETGLVTHTSHCSDGCFALTTDPVSIASFQFQTSLTPSGSILARMTLETFLTASGSGTASP